MKRVLSFLLVILLLLVGCAKTPSTQLAMKPESVIEVFLQAASKGDVDSCLNLLADDIMMQQDPPGVKVEGKAQIETTLKHNAAWHQKFSITSPLKADGEKVALSVKVSSEELELVGLESMNADLEFQIQNGKIKSWLSKPNANDWQRLVELTAGGIGVKYEATPQGIKVTELAGDSPAYQAGLKPGDLIIAVNEISYSQMREGEFQIRVKGPVGSKVKLTTTHEGSPASTEIEVARVNLAELNY